MGVAAGLSVGSRLLPALGMTVAGVSRLRSRRSLSRADGYGSAPSPGLRRLPAKELRRRLASGSGLEGVDLRGVDLARANLSNSTVLRGRDLTGARLQKADLTGADLSGSRLDHADATGASLKGADLRECSVTDVSFVGADLTGADLRGIRNASTATWTRAKHSPSTRWPATYDPRTAGTVIDRLGGDTLALHRLPRRTGGRNGKS